VGTSRDSKDRVKRNMVDKECKVLCLREERARIGEREPRHE